MLKRIENIWYHCKDLQSAIRLKKINKNIKYFCHTQDPYIITSTNHFWVHDLNLTLDKNCIIPLLDEKSIYQFNNKFVYIPCNADVAGLMCRTNIISYPWYSPAGQQRGILNNAIKLAYNPSKAQRDQLYPLRINSIITQPV